MQLKMVIGANRRTRKWNDRGKLLSVWPRRQVGYTGRVWGLNDGWDMKPGLWLSWYLCVSVCAGFLTAQRATCHLFDSASNKITSSNGVGSNRAHTHTRLQSGCSHTNTFKHARCILGTFCNHHPSWRFSWDYAIEPTVAINPHVSRTEGKTERVRHLTLKKILSTHHFTVQKYFVSFNCGSSWLIASSLSPVHPLRAVFPIWYNEPFCSAPCLPYLLSISTISLRGSFVIKSPTVCQRHCQPAG